METSFYHWSEGVSLHLIAPTGSQQRQGLLSAASELGQDTVITWLSVTRL